MTTSAVECRFGLCGGSGMVKMSDPPYVDPISGHEMPCLGGTYVPCSCRFYWTEKVEGACGE